MLLKVVCKLVQPLLVVKLLKMPGMYGEDDYDLAGFAVGIAEKSQIIDGSKVAEGVRASWTCFKWYPLKWLLTRASCLF